MTKAALLSASGDPFLLLMQIKLFQERWYSEVDKLYIGYNNYSGVPSGVISELFSRIIPDRKISIVYHPNGVGAGRSIAELALVAKEDLLLLLEEDGFIFTPGKVEEMFKRIESGEVDALGSPRMSCGVEIAQALKEKYGLDYSGYGDVGPNYWPNFFFCKREDLLKTDLDFNSKSFDKGVFYPELNHEMGETEMGDTFVWASMQLRHLGIRIGDIPQFHASPYEIDEVKEQKRNWMGTVPFWLHAGSLSVGVEGFFNKKYPDVSSDIALQEMETRIAFWMIVSSIVDGFVDFKYGYQKGIEDLVNNCHLDRDRIGQKIGIYRNLIQV